MRLIELRKKNKKTQAEIAEVLNVARNTYQGYEAGRNEPDIDTLKKLSKYFDVSIDYLVENERLEDVGYLTFTQVNVVKLIKQLSYENLMILNGRILAMLENQK